MDRTPLRALRLDGGKLRSDESRRPARPSPAPPSPAEGARRSSTALEIARLLRVVGFTDTAERLEDAYDAETRVLALTIADREAILRALDVAPDGLAELRACSFGSISGG